MSSCPTPCGQAITQPIATYCRDSTNQMVRIEWKTTTRSKNVQWDNDVSIVLWESLEVSKFPRACKLIWVLSANIRPVYPDFWRPTSTRMLDSASRPRNLGWGKTDHTHTYNYLKLLTSSRRVSCKVCPSTLTDQLQLKTVIRGWET